jgi:DNA-binding transcriptional regulator GbsR (MarR family)
MTEITKIEANAQADNLPPAVARFILHWGDMGSQWGVNRSVAQIHALLYLSAEPLTAEAIAETLQIARSNVSNSLKELLGWKLIRRVPILGDRRDHFTAEIDLMEMVTRIAAGRKEREIDPAIAALELCAAEADGDTRIDPVAAERLQEMLGFLRTLDGWYGQMMTVPPTKLMKLIKLGSKIVRFLT